MGLEAHSRALARKEDLYSRHRVPAARSLAPLHSNRRVEIASLRPMPKIRKALIVILSFPLPMILSILSGWFVATVYTVDFYFTNVLIEWLIPAVFGISATLVALGYKRMMRGIGIKIWWPQLTIWLILILTAIFYILPLFSPDVPESNVQIEGNFKLDNLELK